MGTPKTARYTALVGDSLDLLPKMEPGRFDLLLTDPPYAMPATFYEGRKFERRWSDSSILSGWWRAVMAAVLPTMREDAMFAVFANANAVAAFWPVLYEHSTGMQLAVWDKASIGLGAPFRNQCEFIIVGSFGRGYRGAKNVGNVFRVPRVPRAKRSHPSQKPADLLIQLVRHLCPEGGHVLDPFAGTRTSGAACRQLDRSCTSIDWDPPDPSPLFDDDGAG